MLWTMSKQQKPIVFAVNMREERQKRGWGQLRLAEESGVSRGTIADLERGKVQSPDKSTVERVARALDTTVADLWRERPAVSETGQVRTMPEDLPTGLSDFLELRAYVLSPKDKELLLRVGTSIGHSAKTTVEWWEHLFRLIRTLPIDPNGNDGSEAPGRAR